MPNANSPMYKENLENSCAIQRFREQITRVQRLGDGRNTTRKPTLPLRVPGSWLRRHAHEQFPTIAEERTAAQHTCTRIFFIFAAISRLIRICFEKGMRPLPDVAGHIGHPIGAFALRVGVHRRGIAFFSCLRSNCMFSSNSLPQGHSLPYSPRAAFSHWALVGRCRVERMLFQIFRIRGIEPLAIFHGILPGNIHHRMIFLLSQPLTGCSLLSYKAGYCSFVSGNFAIQYSGSSNVAVVFL